MYPLTTPCHGSTDQPDFHAYYDCSRRKTKTDMTSLKPPSNQMQLHLSIVQLKFATGEGTILSPNKPHFWKIFVLTCNVLIVPCKSKRKRIMKGLAQTAVIKPASKSPLYCMSNTWHPGLETMQETDVRGLKTQQDSMPAPCKMYKP
ncbi:4d0c40ae-5240-40e8-8f8d-bd65af5dd005-CDS [Sclerotinia trifoliorum]|uniref:4d0c40ae-5240-40e8-8f8d-bd65af5dd005-CDS n=1 Tax=Sclerotinia trifoliorum TaxID=28548 RepID=A0A8H2ZRK1_9HELO|nr:4d0c40ae-5240-40e8-8f8d-bd65af5dd005-CDS [Sclerotinia trifoliorum]